MTRFEMEQMIAIRKAINEVIIEVWTTEGKFSDDFAEFTDKLQALCEEAWNNQVKKALS